MYDLYKTIESLCQKRGLSINKMCKLSGASQGSVADLKGGRSKTLSAQNISKIAAFFGITTDFLLGRDDEYGISHDEWEVMGIIYKEQREQNHFARALIERESGVTESELAAFEDNGAPLTPAQLSAICGVLNLDCYGFFGAWAGRLWGEKKKPAVEIDDELIESLELLRSRPDVRTLLHASKDMTPAQVERMAEFMLSMKGDKNEKAD